MTKDDVTARQRPPDQPVIVIEPETYIATAPKICSLFNSDFALTRNPDITLKFDQVEANAAGDDKARMIFYKHGDELLTGRLRLKDDRFRFVEDTSASVSRDVMVLDSINPSGNSFAILSSLS